MIPPADLRSCHWKGCTRTDTKVFDQSIVLPDYGYYCPDHYKAAEERHASFYRRPQPIAGDAWEEVAWLIELRGNVPSYFQLAHDDDWTADHNKAVRFARREDAEAAIEYYGWTEAFASEHIWDDGLALRRPAQPSGAELMEGDDPIQVLRLLRAKISSHQGTLKSPQMMFWCADIDKVIGTIQARAFTAAIDRPAREP